MHHDAITIKSAALTIGLLTAVAASPTWAAAEEEGWKSELGLGGVRTGGNTQVQSINATAKTGRSWGAFELNLSGKGLSSSDRGTLTSEKYHGKLNLNYHVSERFFVFQDTSFVKERFSGYKYRVLVTCGAGYDLIKSETHTLQVMVNGGVRRSKLEGALAKTQTEGVGGGSLEYHWVISPTSSFNQTAASQYGKQNTVSSFNSDLNMQIVGNLAAQIGFHVTHTSKVPSPTIKKTDTESLVNLVYSF